MRAVSAKAENVGSYENPFRVKNDSARNTLGIRSVTRRLRGKEGKRGGREKNCGGNRKKFQSSARTRAPETSPENDCSCETQKGSRGFWFTERTLMELGQSQFL